MKRGRGKVVHKRVYYVGTQFIPYERRDETAACRITGLADTQTDSWRAVTCDRCLRLKPTPAPKPKRRRKA